MTLYQNKYRVESARLTGYDYSSSGWYFITICTKNRVQYFGQIVTAETPDPGVSIMQEAKIQLSEIGLIVYKYWNEIPVHFPHLNLDAFQIMPDHIHGIIKITTVGTPDSGVSNTRPTIGIVINLFKRACTIETRNANLKFVWQPRFHDHIIRDDGELQRIRDYIRNNPQNWGKNKL